MSTGGRFIPGSFVLVVVSGFLVRRAVRRDSKSNIIQLQFHSLIEKYVHVSISFDRVSKEHNMTLILEDQEKESDYGYVYKVSGPCKCV